MGLETYTNRIKEFWEPAEIEPERPGEIYSHARRDLPRVIAKLSIGIVLVGAFRMAPIFVAILAILYVCIHGFSKTFARYMEHGADRIAYPMAVCVWALIGWQAVTLGGQATMEVIYRMKVDEDAAYQRQVEAHPGVVAQFQAEEKAREDGWKEREKGRMEREKIRQAGNDQSARRARTLLTLSRENKQIKVSGSIAAEETPAEPAEVFTARPLPVLAPGPAETAPQFLTKWAFRLKLWQLGEFGVALIGLLTLLLCRVSLNRKGREMLVAVQDRELLPLVTITRETIGKLAEWRTPVSPSLPPVEVENEVSEPEPEIEQSGEEPLPCGNESFPRETEDPYEEAELAPEARVEAKNEAEIEFVPTCNDISINDIQVVGTIDSPGEQPWEREIEPEEAKLLTKNDSLVGTQSVPPDVVGTEDSVPRGTIDICGGTHKLSPVKRGGSLVGHNLRYAKKPETGEGRDIKFLGLDKSEPLMAMDLDSQIKEVNRIIEEKQAERSAKGPLRLVARAGK